MTPIERFLDKVALPAHLHDCWEWEGAKTRGGYGNFQANRRYNRAHRFSYEHFIGPIPSKVLVLHSCDNPACINPTHLWLGTQADNMQDMAVKERTPIAARRQSGRKAGLKSRKHNLPEGISPAKAGCYQVFKARKYLGTYKTVEEAAIAFLNG